MDGGSRGGSILVSSSSRVKSEGLTVCTRQEKSSFILCSPPDISEAPPPGGPWHRPNRESGWPADGSRRPRFSEFPPDASLGPLLVQGLFLHPASRRELRRDGIDKSAP